MKQEKSLPLVEGGTQDGAGMTRNQTYKWNQDSYEMGQSVLGTSAQHILVSELFAQSVAPKA